MNRETAAYLGGLFEGELGVVSGSGGRLCLGMTDLDVISRVKSLIGFGQVYGPYKKSGHKLVWYWEASSFETIQAAICYVWEFACARRRAQFVELLTAKRRLGLPARIKSTCSKGHPYDKVATVRGKFNHRYCSICNNKRKRTRRMQQQKKPEKVIEEVTE